VAAAVIGAGFGAYGVREARYAAAARESSENELRQQVTALTARLEEKESARPSPTIPDVPAVRPAPPVAPTTRPVSAKPKRAAVSPVPRSKGSPELKRLEERIAAQDERISGTEKRVDETRAELEGKLSSTRNELDASIARTHDEVVALQKLGQREYFEFQLAKSKQLTPAGPIHIALRKADTKRKRYNIDLLVDDAKLEKKNVYIFEPLYFRVADRPQPVEVVINAIEKDRVRGYVSVPKYKQSELRSQAYPPQSIP
jgi:uncharacterized coiled-coil protein SlyX